MEQENSIPEETQLELDQPSSLDFVYEDVFGSETGEVDSIKFLPPAIQNQGAEAITRMACSRYGMVHIVNAQNSHLSCIIGAQYVELYAKSYWLEYLKENPLAEKDGATLQSALDQFKHNGCITGYSVCNDIESMKMSLQRGRLIYTGSRNGDWISVRDQHIYRLRDDGRVVGHCFSIFGYDPTGWIAINSYGEENGVFSIPYDLTDTLFTRYSVSDSNDEEALLAYRKKIMDDIKIEDARLAVDAGIWNGKNPQAPASREEVAAMILRAQKQK